MRDALRCSFWYSPLPFETSQGGSGTHGGAGARDNKTLRGALWFEVNPPLKDSAQKTLSL